MGNDTFPPWVAKVRNDPLGFLGYNNLLARLKWSEAMFLKEHLATDVGGGSGECNAAEVPREVGGVYVAVGPTYLKEGFRHATGVTRPALGTFALALDTNVYADAAQMTVQIQNTSERGITKPCLSSFVITSTAEIRVHQQYLTSALGAGNAWAAEDDSFAMAIHGPQITVGAPSAGGIRKQRGHQLSDTVTDLNAQIQFDADVRAKFLLDHSAAGVHTCREVARTWAHVEVRSGGAVFQIADTSSRNQLTVTRPGLGICRVTNTTAWALSAQPFVSIDCQRVNGGVEADTYVACVPRSLITTTAFDVYLYKYDFAALSWGRADTDFFVAVHAG